MLKIMHKIKNCASSIITICIQICINKSLLIAEILERLFYWGVFINGSKMHCMFYIDNDCSIRVYQTFVIIFQKYFLLCWHYA